MNEDAVVTVTDRINELAGHNSGHAILILCVDNVWMAEAGMVRHNPGAHQWAPSFTAFAETFEGAVEGLYREVTGRA